MKLRGLRVVALLGPGIQSLNLKASFVDRLHPHELAPVVLTRELGDVVDVEGFVGPTADLQGVPLECHEQLAESPPTEAGDVLEVVVRFGVVH